MLGFARAGAWISDREHECNKAHSQEQSRASQEATVPHRLAEAAELPYFDLNAALAARVVKVHHSQYAAMAMANAVPYLYKDSLRYTPKVTDHPLQYHAKELYHS